MNWFKFYGTEYLADQKMAELTACERSCWITLLCYSSVTNGVVKHVTETKLMQQAGIDFTKDEWNETNGVLQHFSDLGMIVTESNGTITICNWEKRQETYSESYERVKKWREKKQSVTLIKRPIDKNKIEKNRKEEDKETPPKQISQKFFSEPSEQERIILILQGKGIPESIALAEINKFVNYWTELNQSGTKQRWQQQKTFEVQRRLATWFRNINQFQKVQKNNVHIMPI